MLKSRWNCGSVRSFHPYCHIHPSVMDFQKVKKKKKKMQGSFMYSLMINGARAREKCTVRKSAPVMMPSTTHWTRVRTELTIDFTAWERERERERARESETAVMRFQQHAETQAMTGLYKFLIILMSFMFMAVLCYIFINIIKWYLKSPACFRSHTKYENYFNWRRKTSLLRYYRTSIFEKAASICNITVSNNSINIGHCICAWN